MNRDWRGIDPLSAAPPSRHPFQIWLVLACEVSGWITLLTEPNTGFSRDMPHWINVLWGMLLASSALLALASAYWKDRITGLMMESIALRALGAGTISYGGFLYYSFGFVATMPASIIIGLGAACLWRVVHISREMYVLKRLMASRGLVEGRGD